MLNNPCPLKRNKCTILRQRIPQPLPQTCLLLFSTPTAFPFSQGRHERSDFPNRKANNFILRISIFQPEAPCYKLFFQNCFHSTFFSLLSAFHDKNSHETPPSCFTHPGKQKLLMENQPANSIAAKTKDINSRQLNLHNSLLFKEVPPTGLEPVRPCGQQILSLQRLPFRHGGIDRTALYRNAAGIQHESLPVFKY